MSTNTNNLANIESNTYKKQLCKVTGCCGAASDAWVPSYPSVFINDQSLNSLSLVESSSSSLLKS